MQNWWRGPAVCTAEPAQPPRPAHPRSSPPPHPSSHLDVTLQSPRVNTSSQPCTLRAILQETLPVAVTVHLHLGPWLGGAEPVGPGTSALFLNSPFPAKEGTNSLVTERPDEWLPPGQTSLTVAALPLLGVAQHQGTS